ncbi:MAG TPA: hypothetical protein VF982_11610, partial [Anaerolineales bacterium]
MAGRPGFSDMAQRLRGVPQPLGLHVEEQDARGYGEVEGGGPAVHGEAHHGLAEGQLLRREALALAAQQQEGGRGVGD